MSVNGTEIEEVEVDELHESSQVDQDEVVTIPADDLTAESPKRVRSLLGKAIYLKGDITTKEDLFINGCVEGSVSLKANILEVGINGHIHANVFAREVIVGGELIGDVYASDRVIITKTGRVTGDIYTADVSIEDGAHVNGNIDMQRQDVFKHHDESHAKQQKKSGFFFKKRDIAPSEPVIQHTHSNVNIMDEIPTTSVNTVLNEPYAYENCSVLGESVAIKGELAAGEDVVIQGQLDGAIYFKNHNLGVGSLAQIKGHVFVKSLVMYGEIKGDIYAGEQVIIKKPGRAYGKVHSPRFTAERGAVLMGMIEMGPLDVDEKIQSVVGHATTEHVCHQDGAAHATRNQAAATTGNGGDSKETAWPIFYLRS